MSNNGIPKLLANTVYRPIAWFANSKIARKAGNEVYANNRKYIDGLGVASIIAKDGLGCYLYVTQSLNNKDIPDDKRKFVASLDLTNGILMILLQLAMFFTVSNKVCQTKMFDKFFGKLFDRPVRKTYYKLVQNQPGFEDINGIKFNKEFQKIRGNVKDAFGGLTSLAAATIVGKRMLVPLIATPLADKVEKKMTEHEAKKKGLPASQPKDDKSNPAMKGVDKPPVNKNTPEPVKTQPIQTSNNSDTNTNLLTKYRK